MATTVRSATVTDVTDGDVPSGPGAVAGQGAGSGARTMAGPVVCGCALAATAVYVAAVDPSEDGGLLPCPFRTVTGLWCPGCGLTRATHHLLRGDLVQALRFNLFVVVVLGAIAASWLHWTLATAGRTWGRFGDRRRPGRPAVVWLAVAVMTVFAVVRNLPGVHGLTG